MGRAEDLFNKIKSEGIDAINDFIENRCSEELFLDFKRSSDDGVYRKLHQNDRNNFADAISGFGNSEGGIVIWGVDCSKDSLGADVAKAKFPLKDGKKFLSWLQNVITSSTVPPHKGVENIFISEKEDEGYVISLIPKSELAPHQTIHKQQYLMRTGSSFSPVPHSVLAGMFGRRPQPDIFQNYITGPAEVHGDKIKFSIGIMLCNKGPGIAESLFLNMDIYSSPFQIKFEPTSRESWTGQWALNYKLNLISNVGIRIAPKAVIQPVVVHCQLKPPFDRKLEVHAECGCANALIYTFEFRNTKNRIQKLYNDFIIKNNNNA